MIFPASAGAFLGLDAADCGEDSLGVVLPIPYEATTTYRQGTAAGPEAILQASQQVEFYDEWLEDEARAYGVRTMNPLRFAGPPQELAVELKQAVGQILDAEKFPLLLGGEHSLSLGPIQAAVERHPDLVVLHLDAHPDLRDQYEGTAYGHGCVMRRVLETGCQLYSFGLRAISPEERDFYAAKPENLHWLTARQLLPLSAEEKVAAIVRGLPAGPLWLSWDCDGLDPALVPSTGTPEPGGMDWYTVSELLRQLDGQKRWLVGAELLELMPQSQHHASDFACARLAHRMLLAGLRSRRRKA